MCIDCPKGTFLVDKVTAADKHDALADCTVCAAGKYETVAPGESLAAVVEQGLPISHLCIGQEVPADIVVADAMQLAHAAFDCEPTEATA